PRSHIRRITHITRCSSLIQRSALFSLLLLLTLVLSFFLSAPAPTEIYTLSLHDALRSLVPASCRERGLLWNPSPGHHHVPDGLLDRKSTRLNSSHVSISYAVFCLKKKSGVAAAGVYSLGHVELLIRLCRCFDFVRIELR